MDKALPVGSSITCAHYSRFSNALAFIHQNLTKYKLENYLDDFLFVDGANDRVQFQMDMFANTCDKLSLTNVEDKTEGPTLVIRFWGLLDALRRRVGIPEAKVSLVIGMLEMAIKKKKTQS